MKINLLFLVNLILLIFGCEPEKEIITPATETTVSLDNTINFIFKQIDNPGKIQEDVLCLATSNLITGSVPYLLPNDTLIASFSLPAGYIATVNNVAQVSGVTKNDFSKPVEYLITSSTGLVAKYKVNLSTFTGLPILQITTENNQEVNSKEEYIKAQLVLKSNNQSSQGQYNGAIEIKGRGNSTWLDMPKKPYKIKLNQKAPLLDMPADKEWVLLANYADKTLLRNFVSLELGRRLGFKYTPRARFVEVFLNQEYLGNYLLTEQIKIAKDRLDIKEMDSNDQTGDLITGGYLLEIDVRQDADYWFKTKNQVSFCVKSPENITANQFEYIKNYVQETENVLYGDSFTDPIVGYAKYINVDSFVNFYLLNEITKNSDAAFHTSVYVYKDRNGKLSMGPPWDFDIALGNVDYNDNSNPEGIYMQNSKWINRLFEDPVFVAKVVKRFNEIKSTQLNTLSPYIYQQALALNRSQAENFQKWDILNTYVWPNSVVLGTYEKEVAFLADWLEKRITWLDYEFNQQL